MEEQVESLKLLKETAEKPEKEAKDMHQKAWEGMLYHEVVVGWVGENFMV